MCLTEVLKRIKQEEMTAYKVFIRDPIPHFKFNNYKGSSLVPLNKWIFKESVYGDTIGSYLSEEYPTGFHCYKTRIAAEANSTSVYIVYKVKVRGVHTIGKEGKYTVLVADQMYVPSKQ